MDHRIFQVQHHPLALTKGTNTLKSNQAQSSFKQTLQEANSLVISKHAQKRLTERNIMIDDRQWKAIQTKVDEARQKGIGDSLVVLNQAALIINVKNNTVITAMNKNEAISQIFTNINGTILLD